MGCFPLCQRFRKFRLEFKWKGPFRFLLTGIFGITSGGGPHISVGIFRPKFAVPFLTKQFFALIRESGRRIWNDKSHFYWLAQFYRKMSFHFPQVFPLISDRSVWHNGKHPWCLHVHVRKHCFILTEACSCRLELGYFAGRISKNRLVCKNAVALAPVCWCCYCFFYYMMMENWLSM